MGAPVEPTAEAQPRTHVAPTFLENAVIHEQPPTQLDMAVRRAQTKDALVGLGWKPAIARAAVAAAWATVGSRATLEQLIVEALRQCPRSFTATERAPQAS
jgi:Holliday junction resolvasome RuvABC DNA-binding subunit